MTWISVNIESVDQHRDAAPKENVDGIDIASTLKNLEESWRGWNSPDWNSPRIWEKSETLINLCGWTSPRKSPLTHVRKMRPKHSTIPGLWCRWFPRTVTGGKPRKNRFESRVHLQVSRYSRGGKNVDEFPNGRQSDKEWESGGGNYSLLLFLLFIGLRLSHPFRRFVHSTPKTSVMSTEIKRGRMG